jgi:hypothetical protein
MMNQTNLEDGQLLTLYKNGNEEVYIILRGLGLKF